MSPPPAGGFGAAVFGSAISVLQKIRKLPISYMNVTNQSARSFMSFEGAWGFDPQEALRVQNLFLRGVEGVPEERQEGEDCVKESFEIPITAELQTYELRRIFGR